MYQIITNKGIVSVTKTSSRLFIEEDTANRAIAIATSEGTDRVLEFLADYEQSFPNLRRVVSYALERLSSVEDFLK